MIQMDEQQIPQQGGAPDEENVTANPVVPETPTDAAPLENQAAPDPENPEPVDDQSAPDAETEETEEPKGETRNFFGKEYTRTPDAGFRATS